MPRTYIPGERFEWDGLFAPLIGTALVVALILHIGGMLLLMWAGLGLAELGLAPVILAIGAALILVFAILAWAAYRAIEGMSRGRAAGFWTTIRISGPLALFSLWFWSPFGMIPGVLVGGIGLLDPLARLTGWGPRPV